MSDLVPAQVYDPLDLISTEIRKLDCRMILGFGEKHDDGGTLEYEIALLRGLSERGFRVKAVFLEEAIEMAPRVRDYYSLGRMDSVLRDYLLHGFVRSSWPNSHKLELVRICRSSAIPVIFIDDNKVPARDADWAHKISEEVGAELDRIYILIAGRNHVSHSSKVYIEGRVTAMSLLDKLYSGRTVTVNCQINEIAERHPLLAVERKFLSDLREIGMSDSPAAVMVKNSPYHNLSLAGPLQAPVPAGDAFDMLVAVPGKILAKAR